MKHSNLLMPYTCKRIGCIVFAAALVLLALRLVASLIGSPAFTMELSVNDLRALFGQQPLAVDANNFSHFGPESDLVRTISGLLLIVGSVMVGFSRCRREDEFIEQLRYQSLVLSIYLNAAVLVLGYLFCWGLTFLVVMQFNMFFTLFFYLAYFHVRLWAEQRRLRNEE